MKKIAADRNYRIMKRASWWNSASKHLTQLGYDANSFDDNTKRAMSALVAAVYSALGRHEGEEDEDAWINK